MQVEFKIDALADAQTVSRVLEHFALRDLVVSSLTARVDGDAIHLVIQHADLDGKLAILIAEKIRASVLVSSVQLTAVEG